MSPTQLPLDLPFRATAGHGEFIVSRCNQFAADTIGQWPDWVGQIRAVNLVGPDGAGKTHLASVWQEMSEAKILDRLDPVKMDSIEGGYFILENMTPGPDWDETSLFLLLNRVKDEGGGVVATSRQPLSQMAWALPDLRSRLRAFTVAEIAAPDDQLLLALLQKYFVERQLAVPDQVLHYLVTRMERSFATVTAVASALDRQSLAGNRQINLGLARDVLSELNGAE